MKKKIPALILFVALFFSVDTIQASPEDSLRNVISNTDGVEKLKALNNLQNLKYYGNDGLDYVIMLEEEARKQNNERFLGIALTNKANLFAIQKNDEKFFPAAEEAMAFLLERKIFDFYFLLYNTVIKVHLNDGNYETAFLKVSLMLEDAKKFDYLFGEICAYENMGDAYYIEKNFQEATESYRKAFSLLSIFPERLNIRAEIGVKIANNAYHAGDMLLTILYCDSVRQLVEEYDRIITVTNNNISTSHIKNMLHANLALAYISIGRDKEATDAMSMALRYAEDDIAEDYRKLFYFLCSDYYSKKGEYMTALEYINKCEAHTDVDLMPMKSNILAAMGDFEGAHKVDREYIEITDSLNRKKLAQRVSELQTIHQVEKIEFQAEQDRLKVINQRQFIVGLTVIVLLLACVIFVVIHNLNRIKRKNLVLYQRIQSHEELELEFKRKEDALRANLLSEDKTSEDDEADQIYLRLKDLMKDEKNYIDINVTRKGIATKLGTNERYLYETITKYLGLGFAEYINVLRLDYARDMISKKLNDLDIEDIAIMSGFGTRQTFHRLFRDRYGLSPSEFSRMLKNF
jgi:AraC-type DNA-binding domain-containing proteins